MLKKKISFLLFLILPLFSSAQVDENKMLQIAIADSILNPFIVVVHSMGDVNVKGHEGAELLVYAQELLPSLAELSQQNQAQVFSFFDKHLRQPVTVSRNNNFSVQQIGNMFQIETNVFSFNNHVFVMAPQRSSVAVHSRDIGNIIVENFLGDVEAEGNSGHIFLKDIEGKINAATVHGNVVADLSNEKQVQPLFISTFIGNIEIIAQKNVRNTVLLSSEMGNLYSNFDTVNTIAVASDRRQSNNRKLSFDLNGGGTEFVLNTFKGDIYLRYHEQ